MLVHFRTYETQFRLRTLEPAWSVVELHQYIHHPHTRIIKNDNNNLKLRRWWKVEAPTKISHILFKLGDAGIHAFKATI